MKPTFTPNSISFKWTSGRDRGGGGERKGGEGERRRNELDLDFSKHARVQLSHVSGWLVRVCGGPRFVNGRALLNYSSQRTRTSGTQVVEPERVRVCGEEGGGGGKGERKKS